VEEICDHIILVNKGRKILDGTVKQVKQQFKEHQFRISFDEEPRSTESDVFQVIEKKDHELVVKIREGRKPNDVLQFFLDQPTGINAFQEILPSLNEIFIRLVEGTPTTRQFESINA
jgi:ABC-2 type transport system ATP-binding protein